MPEPWGRGTAGASRYILCGEGMPVRKQPGNLQPSVLRRAARKGEPRQGVLSLLPWPNSEDNQSEGVTRLGLEWGRCPRSSGQSGVATRPSCNLRVPFRSPPDGQQRRIPDPVLVPGGPGPAVLHWCRAAVLALACAVQVDTGQLPESRDQICRLAFEALWRHTVHSLWMR